MNISSLIHQFRQWVDKKNLEGEIAKRNRKLQKARKLIIDACGTQIPGNIVSIDNKAIVIEDVILSIRKNTLTVQRTRLRNAYTRKQRSALMSQMKKPVEYFETDV